MISYNKQPYTVPAFPVLTNNMSPEERKAKLQMFAAERDAVEIARMRQLQEAQYLQRQEAAKNKNTAKSTELETYSLRDTRGIDIKEARRVYPKLKDFNTQMFTGSSKEAKAYRFYPGAWTDGPIYVPPGSKKALEYEAYTQLAAVARARGATASDLGRVGLDPQDLEFKLRNSSIPDFTKVYQPKFYDFEQALLRAEAQGASADQGLVNQMNSLKEELLKLSKAVMDWASDPLVQGAAYFWAGGRAADKKEVRRSNQRVAEYTASVEASRLKFVNNPEEFIRSSQSNLVKEPGLGESAILINRPDLDQLKAPRAAKQKPIPKLKPPRLR